MPRSLLRYLSSDIPQLGAVSFIIRGRLQPAEKRLARDTNQLLPAAFSTSWRHSPVIVDLPTGNGWRLSYKFNF